MPNQGEVYPQLRTKGARDINTTFQVAKVTGPLWSVARICDAGFKVVFDAKGAEVLTRKGKVVCRFERIGNLYRAKLDLRNPGHEGFARQGRAR